MAANLTHEHFHALARAKAAAERYADKIREKFEGKTVRAIRTVEICTGALIGGVLEGHAGAGGSKIFGIIPTNLGLGVLLNGLGYFDVAGEHSEHLNNFGDGFLATEVSNIGHGLGANAKANGWFHMFGHAKNPASLPAGGTAVHGTIHPDQMADIVNRVRAAAG